MGQLTISHNFTGETGYIIAVPKLTTMPLADVICTIDGVTGQTRIAYAAPHEQRSILIEDLLNRWYFIKFYRSADGTSLDEELLTLAGNASTGAVYPITKLEYVVGRGDDSSEVGEIWADPVQDDHGIRDERLNGKYYWVEERGTGTLLEAEIVDKSDEGGGFDFADPDKVFNDGGVYIVKVVERAAAPDSSTPVAATGDFNEVVVLISNTTYDPLTHGGRLIIANWSATIGTLTIPALASVANSKFRLQTHGGSQRNVIIQLNGGETVKFLTEDMNAIILGKGEEIEILIVEGVMYVSFYDGDYRRVGRRVDADLTEINGILLNGQQFDQVDVPRLMWWIDKLPAAQVTDELTWSNSVTIDGKTRHPFKGLYGVGLTTVTVPDMRNMSSRTLKTFDLNNASDTDRVRNVPGGYQVDGIGPHMHPITGVNRSNFSGGGRVAAVGATSDEDAGSTAINIPEYDNTRPENIGQLKLLII